MYACMYFMYVISTYLTFQVIIWLFRTKYGTSFDRGDTKFVFYVLHVLSWISVYNVGVFSLHFIFD